MYSSSSLVPRLLHSFLSHTVQYATWFVTRVIGYCGVLVCMSVYTIKVNHTQPLEEPGNEAILLAGRSVPSQDSTISNTIIYFTVAVVGITSFPCILPS